MARAFDEAEGDALLPLEALAYVHDVQEGYVREDELIGPRNL